MTLKEVALELTSWLFEELTFLADLEKPVDRISSIDDVTNNDKVRYFILFLKI